MGSGDTGTWKLLIYPLGFLLFIGIMLNLVIQPFIDNGIDAPKTNNGLAVILSDTLNWFHDEHTILFVDFHFLSDAIYNVLNNQVNMLLYLPEVVQSPIVLMLTVSFVYVAYVLVTMLIP